MTQMYERTVGAQTRVRGGARRADESRTTLDARSYGNRIISIGDNRKTVFFSASALTNDG